MARPTHANESPIDGQRIAGSAGSWARIVPVVLAIVGAVCCQAGTYNPDRSIGDTVPGWTDLPGTDGRRHSWTDLADRDAVVVVFTCNSCPYAVDYEQRINALTERFAGPDSRVAVVAINSNLIAEDSPAAMQHRAATGKFLFPYLFDESQTVARSFGAVRTPEFYVLDRDRRIVYMGAMDDDTNPSAVRRPYVLDAVNALLEGREIAVKETPPVGCLIRFTRRRPAR